MKTKQMLFAGMMLITLLLAAVAPVAAQSSDLTLNVKRDMGYGGFGGDIRGTFTLSVSGPDNLQSVTYLIDGQPMQEVTAPFKLQFNTGSYPPGVHRLSAVGLTADGRTLTSNNRQYTFLSAEQESSAMGKIFIPLGIVLGGIVIVMLLATFLNVRTGKREELSLGAERTYGAFGGAVCPKCHRPFSMHWWAFNAGILSKFDRCPYCAHWSVVKRAPMDALRRAEQAELGLASPGGQVRSLTEEEKLRQQLESSRYEKG